MMKRIATFISLAFITTCCYSQKYETPTMGWSSWNTYGVNISETIIRKQASAMRQKGLLTAGYKYINIDDGYFGGRDSQGNLLIHPTRFPNGMKPVVEYIHKLGMKAGIYSDAGYNTCGSMFNGDKIGEGVGFYKHDQQDADFFFKELGFDFIKVDFCGGSYYHNKDHLVLSEKERYTAIHNAILNTGRDDVRMNVCRWAYPGTWVHDVGCSWRTTGDINCSWESIRNILKENMYLSAYAYEGHFNDMDMLEVGRGLSEEEDKTHFGMWCIMSSPLLIGCDMSTLKTSTLRLLKNSDLIALNQDSLCLQAYVVQHKNDTYILVKEIETLYGKTRAVAFYNPTDAAVNMSLDFADIELAGHVNIRDLFTGEESSTDEKSYSVQVPVHGTRIYRFEADERLERRLYEAETAYLSNYQELESNQSAVSGSYDEVAVCSGGAKVGWLGNSNANDLQWRHVYSLEGGKYTMTLKYISGESRYVSIQVNEGTAKRISANSGGWDRVGSKSMEIELQPGENVIRLFNKTAWMPDIDCMTLTYNGPLTDIEGVNVSKSKTGTDTYNLKGQKMSESQVQSAKGIFISRGKKHLNR